MMTSIQKTLIEIQKTHSFEGLEPLKNAQVWSKMPDEERELFALLLLKQGSQQLAKGDNCVLENFDLASKVSPNAAQIFYLQGKIFADHTSNSRCLTLAAQAFSQSIESDKTNGLVWYDWARVLMKMAHFYTDSTYVLDAHTKFETAFTLLEDSKEISKSEFHWQWGRCWILMGKVSGEPSDFHRGIQCYQEAAKLGCTETGFLIDHGSALIDIATLMDRGDLYQEALNLFDTVIEQVPDSFEGLYHRAFCLCQLHEMTDIEEYAHQAFETFEKAAAINPSYPLVWMRWGQLELHVGKQKRDLKYVESSLEKFAKAHELDPENSEILSCWSETELFLGAQYEQLELLQSAKQKIIKSLELQPENAEGWYLYGSCLNEIGRYFSEAAYYHQAIEKFHYGLSLCRDNPLIWYGLALAHFALGELTENLALVEKAVRYCSCAVESGGNFPQFWNDWGVSLMKMAELTGQHQYIKTAIEKFENALKHPVLNLEHEEDVDLEWVYNYGCAYDLLGDATDEPRHFEKAVGILSQVVQLDPDYASARYNLALALSHLGEATFDVEPYHKAIEHFQMLVDADSEDDMAHMDFGVCLINLAILVHDTHHPARSEALYRQAEGHLMQAAALGNGQAYYQLACLYSLTVHYDSAIYYMERAQVFKALPPIEDLMHDDWLEGLRQTSVFKHFIAHLPQQYKEDK